MGGLLGSCCVAPHMSPEISFTGVVLNIGTAGVCVWSGLGVIPFSVHPQLFGVYEASKRCPPPQHSRMDVLSPGQADLSESEFSGRLLGLFSHCQPIILQALDASIVT